MSYFFIVSVLSNKIHNNSNNKKTKKTAYCLSAKLYYSNMTSFGILRP